jgi:hypothetical protein
MSRVFITSNRMRKDSYTGALKPIVDLRPAEQFGSLNAVFDHEMEPTNKGDLIRARERLAGFDPDYDYILPNGSPLATLATGIMLGELRSGETVQTLMWDKMHMRYQVGVIEL